MTKELWSFLIEGTDDNTGLFRNLYAYGSHLGEAIDNAISAAIDFNDARIVEAGKASTADLAGEDLVPVNENVFMQKQTFSYPLEDGEQEFILPVGVIKAEEDGELEYDLIEEGFAAYDKDKNGFYSCDLVVSRARAVNTLFRLITSLPGMAGISIAIKKHWDDRKDEQWSSPDYKSAQKVLDFLEKNTASVLQNGLIDCSVYSTRGTALTFDEHKKINFETTDKKTFESYLDALYKMKFEHIDELHSIDYGYYHWHYRPGNSLTRSEFIDMLKASGFCLSKG